MIEPGFARELVGTLDPILNLEVAGEGPDPDRVTDLIKNGGGTNGAWGWLSPVDNTAIGWGIPGLNMWTAIAQPAYFESEFFAVEDTHIYAEFGISAGTAGASMRARIVFYDVDYAPIGQSAQSAVVDVPAGGFGNFGSIPATAKTAGTVYGKVRLDLYRAGGNPAANDHAVVFNVHAASSTLADLTDGFVTFDDGWTSILSASAELTIDRAELDLGTMTATIVSPELDPAVTEVIRKGNGVRCWVSGFGNDESLFEGTIQNAKVTYDLLHPDENKRTRIALTCVDVMGALAGVKRPETVGTIGEVTQLLEGAGVPWNVNGERGGVITPAVVVSTNDSASIVDQVAIARDTALGYAWVSRDGILNVWDAAELDGDLMAARVLDESAYAPDVLIDFDTERLINYVTVKLQRTNPESGEAEELTFGPYTDEASRKQWGTAAKEFTVAGLDETTIPSYAAAILAANSTPTRRLIAATVPIRNADDFDEWALIDLYDLVHATNDRAGVDAGLRVTSVTHRISCNSDGVAWAIDLGFLPEGAVASPQSVPAPTASNAATLAELLRPLGELTAFYCTAAQVPAGWLECDGSTFDPDAYPKLFAHLGTNTLPDWNDRFLIGASGSKAVGLAGGNPTHSLTAAQLPAHTHPILRGSDEGTSGTRVKRSGNTVVADANSSPNSGTAASVDHMPPWRAARICIRAR